MDKDWIKVYSASEKYKIEIVKAVLADNDIPSFEIDKKDSSYIAIGEIELYVLKENSETATSIINENSL